MLAMQEQQAKIESANTPKRAGGFATAEDAQVMANNMAKLAGPGFFGRTNYDPKNNIFSPEVVREQPQTVADPYVDLARKQKFAQDQSIVAAAKGAASTISVADRVIDQIDSGDVNTGLASTVNQYKDKVFSVFGSESAANRASATELLEAAQGGLFLDQRAKEKITSTMLNTANELNFYRGIFAGTKQMEPQTIKKLASLQREIAVASIESYNRALISGDLDEYLKATGSKKQAMEVPKQRTVVSDL
jgi:hypothetical protein